MSYNKINMGDVEDILATIILKGLDEGTEYYRSITYIENSEEEKMEQWETEMREKLNDELEDGCYKLGVGCYGGKQAKINFEIALAKLIRREPKE